MGKATRKRRLSLAATVATLAVAAAACGSAAPAASSNGTNPRAAVDQAFSALGHQPGLQVTVSLPLTPGQIQQLSSQGGGSQPSAKEAQALSETRIVVDSHTTNGANLSAVSGSAASSDVRSAVDLVVGSDRPVQLVSAGSTLYARLDLPTLLGDFGQSSTAPAASLQGDLAKIAPLVPGIQALGQGKWVSADVAPLEAQAAGKAPTTGQAAQLASDLRADLDANATFTSDGSHGGRDEYRVDIHAKAFVEQLVTAAEKDIPAFATVGGQAGTAAAKIPASQQVSAQVFVSGGTLQEVDIDLNQFSSKVSQTVPLRVSFAGGSSVALPSGATPLDLSGLSTLLGQGAG